MKIKTIAFLTALLLVVLAGCNNAPLNEDKPQPFSFSESVQSASESEAPAEKESKEVETTPEAVQEAKPEKQEETTETDTVSTEQPQTASVTGQAAQPAEQPDKADKTEHSISTPQPDIPKESETPAPPETEETPSETDFDINYWISFAKDYAQSVGLLLDSEAVYCWDRQGYFDISDTHPSRFSRRVPIWQMRDEYTAEVIDTLESTFGELNDKETLAVAIESAARNAVEDNIPDYLPDLIYSVKDSFLDGVSEEEITHIFKTVVRNSVAYMTMIRLGIEAGEYFEPDDLRDVVNFTTPATLNALGYATSDIAEMGLAEISRTILALDRQNRIIAEKTKADYNVGKEKTERSPDNERDHLHEAGGLSAPRSDNAGAAGAVDGQVRPDAEEVPEGASQGTLLQPADELRPERASERHGAQSERDGTDADGADGSVGGRDGESESDGYDELGSEDEQYPEPGSGDRDGGGNLRLGHADVSTTMNIYVDVTDALKKKEITAFDDYMTTKLET